MLKTAKTTRSAIEPKKIKNKFDGNSVVGNNMVIIQKSSTKRKNQVETLKFKNLVKLKNYDFSLNSRNMGIGPSFFTFETRLTFIK